MTRNEELHKLMKDNKMGRLDVARLIGAPISKTTGQCHTLANWLAAPLSGAHRQIPVATLMLLKMQLARVTPAERAKWVGPLDKKAVLAANRKKRECEARGYVYADGVVKKKAGAVRYTHRYPKEA